MFCARNQSGAQCITLDIAHDSDQVTILLNQERFEATLPQAPTSLIFPMMTTHMGGEEPMRPARQISLTDRPHDYVQMVWHQTGRQNRNIEGLLRLNDERQKCSVVGVIAKDVRLIVTPVDEVVAIAADDCTSRARHAVNVAQGSYRALLNSACVCRYTAEMRNVPILVGTGPARPSLRICDPRDWSFGCLLSD